MSQFDLPSQQLLQQSAARPVSGEELETYGKHAADLYGTGKCASLNEAVVETIKSAGLAPEQVRRVVEFTNTHAFLTEFKKESTASKYVSFDKGPAAFNDILQDLNDGGGGTVFDRGTLDYSHVPTVKSAARAMDKTASALPSNDDVLAAAFAVDHVAPPLPFANPLGDVHDLQDKLASIRDAQALEISSLELDLQAVTEELYCHIKQASLQGGVPLGSIVQAWHMALDPDPEAVKVAFSLVGPRLVADQVFTSWDDLGASLEKTAGVSSVVNAEHPIIVAFGACTDITTKLAHLRAAQEEVAQGIAQLTTFACDVQRHYGEVIQ